VAEACYTRGKVNSIEIAAAVLDAVEKGEYAMEWNVYAGGMTLSGKVSLENPEKGQEFPFQGRQMEIVYVDMDSRTLVCDYVTKK